MGKQILYSTYVTDLETRNVCAHNRIREIGEDFDEEGRLLRLIRCQGCGLLMREYLPFL